MLKQLVALRKRAANWPWAGIGLTTIYFGGLVLLSSYHPTKNEANANSRSHEATPRVYAAPAPIRVKPRSTTSTPAQQNNKPGNDLKNLTWLITYHDEIIAIGTLALALFAFMQWRESRRSSQRQLRAYIDVDVATYESNPHIANAPWDITVTLRNFGQTPARNVVVTLETAVGAARNDCVVFQFSPSARTMPSTRIPPGHKIIISGPGKIAPGAMGFSQASATNQRAYIWGQVSYCDVFEKEWTLCFQMICSFNGVMSFSYCPAGNSEQRIRDMNAS